MDNITRLYVACCEVADALNANIRSGPDAIRGVLRETSSPTLGELFQLAFADVRRDDSAGTAGRALTRLHRRANELRNVAAAIANYDVAPTTYPPEWFNAMAEFNESRQEAWGFCPPDSASISPMSEPNAAKSRRKNTAPGDADKKIISALCTHREFREGGCKNMTPIGNNELARMADCSTGTVSGFWRRRYKKFKTTGSYESYKVSCMNGKLPAMISHWRGEHPAEEVLQMFEDDIRTRIENE